MRFSERMGLQQVRDSIQKDEISKSLRNGLWDALDMNIWSKVDFGRSHYTYVSLSNLETLLQRYWHSFYQLPIDTIPSYFANALDEIRGKFMGCEWFEVYDFIEFTAKACPERFQPNFTEFCNLVLDREKSAFRFVERELVELTSDEELKSIEEALSATSPYEGAKNHLLTALNLLSDRQAPDYRNSIKESVSAIESLANLVSGEKNASLGKLLKTIDPEDKMHPALKKAYSNLYGYTSNADGIRHAMMEKSTLSYDDAKFMLVACTAFTNYVLSKLSD